MLAMAIHAKSNYYFTSQPINLFGSVRNAKNQSIGSDAKDSENLPVLLANNAN